MEGLGLANIFPCPILAHFFWRKGGKAQISKENARLFEPGVTDL
jgi:hypothetical protein